MSTRANVIIESKEWNEKLYFYRHSDGYPDEVMPTLRIFENWLKEGKIRDNVSQCAGWLILLGAIEYQTLPEHSFPKGDIEKHYMMNDEKVDKALNFMPRDWKCGSYEPTFGLHDDIGFLYIIDLDKKEVREEKNWEQYK